MKQSLVFFLAFGSVFLGFSSHVRAERIYAHEVPRFERGRLALINVLDATVTQQNYGTDGKDKDILGKNFETYNLYMGSVWDLSDQKSLNFGFQAAQSFSLRDKVDRKNFNFKGLQLGFSYKQKPFRHLHFSWDLKYFHSLADNDLKNDEVSLGDGVNWASLGLWLGTKEYEYGKFWIYSGVKHPFGSLATTFHYGVRLLAKYEAIYLGGVLDGQLPIIEDKAKEDPTARLLFLDKANAGSFHYMGIDSAYTDVGGWLGFELAPYTLLKLGGTYPVVGKNTSRGPRFFMKLEMSFSITQGGYQFPYFKVDKAGVREKTRYRKTRLKNYKKK